MRIGNEEYRRENGSFGLTTLRGRHAEVIGSRVRFQFRGKSGKKHSVEVNSRGLARVVKDCQEIPGQELFQYLNDDGIPTAIESGDVNQYLKEISGGEFTAKDFRTWAGSVLATEILSGVGPSESEKERNRQLALAVDQVAIQLGNTPTVCRKCYVHPTVIDSFMDGSMGQIRRNDGRVGGPEAALSNAEQLFVRLLRSRSMTEAESSAA